MSKLVLDDVLEYLAVKAGDVQAAESMLLNMNQDELEYMFDMAERHYERPIHLNTRRLVYGK